MGITRIQRISFKKKIIQFVWLMLIPPLVTTLLLLYQGNFPFKVWITSLTFVLVATFVFSRWLLSSIFRPIQSASNLVSSVREGDYSMQSRPSSTSDPLGELYQEINHLISIMQVQHRKTAESEILLRGVMDYLDVAVFALDRNGHITLANKACCSLLNTTSDICIGRHYSEYHMDDFVEKEDEVPFRHTFAAQTGRWFLHRTEFRENGVPHTLFFLQDMSKSLREEERNAWKRLIRVMGHELNNSLAPIKSISGTLDTLVEREEMDPELKEDLEDGLHVIHKRADALSRFVDDYSKIAKLPPPNKELFDLKKTMKRIVGLQDFKGCNIELMDCPGMEIYADEAQIEQLLINLTKNAIEANEVTGGKANVRCLSDETMVILEVLDEGQGLASSDNLFIPFYSTKPNGSGIGLTLSQQIAENHEGTLELANRTDRSGCIASLILPHQHVPCI